MSEDDDKNPICVSMWCQVRVTVANRLVGIDLNR